MALCSYDGNVCTSLVVCTKAISWQLTCRCMVHWIRWSFTGCMADIWEVWNRMYKTLRDSIHVNLALSNILLLFIGLSGGDKCQYATYKYGSFYATAIRVVDMQCMVLQECLLPADGRT